MKLKNEKITLNLVKADAIETLGLISKISGYGTVLIEKTNGEDSDDNEVKNLPQITARFENENISLMFFEIQILTARLMRKLAKG